MSTPFENAIADLEQQIASLQQLAQQHGLDVRKEVQVLEQKLHRMKEESYRNLTPMERVQLARTIEGDDPDRPVALREDVLVAHASLLGDGRGRQVAGQVGRGPDRAS